MNRHATRNFSEQGKFLGIRALINIPSTTHKGKVAQEIILGCILLDTLKSAIWMSNLIHRWPQSEHFFPKIMARKVSLFPSASGAPIEVFDSVPFAWLYCFRLHYLHHLIIIIIIFFFFLISWNNCKRFCSNVFIPVVLV